MNKTRLEAFSDGVLAIIITIMVLEIKVPHGSEWSDLAPLVPVFFSYVLSFIYVGIYWGNHHHLLHTVKQISPGIIWANMNQLFWLSLIPFSTGWMGENHFNCHAVALYSANLLLCGMAYNILQKTIERHAQDTAQLKKAFANVRKKGIVSALGYIVAIPLAYVNTWVSGILIVIIAILWLIPDRSIERALNQEEAH